MAEDERDEQRDETDTALVPLDDADTGPPGVALLNVYAQLPGAVVARCEYERQAIARDVLDHLRVVRDALAPYGLFKDWCAAAGVNYEAVKHRLWRRDQPKQPAEVRSYSAPMLDAPEDAQAARIRALEAQVAAYEARNAEEWAREADHEAMVAQYSAKFAGERAAAGDEDRTWAEGLDAEAVRQVDDAGTHLDVLCGAHTHLMLAVARDLLRVRRLVQDIGHTDHFDGLMRKVSERWLRIWDLPVTPLTQGPAVAYWEWLMERAVEYGLDTPEARAAVAQREGLPHRMSHEQEVIAAVTVQHMQAVNERESEAWEAAARACGQLDDGKHEDE
jgi:hypothetical protein